MSFLFPMHCINKGDEIMESPKTYKGYDQTGKVIVTKNAADASQEIDPKAVRAGIDNVKEVFTDEMCKLARSLRNISADASEAVIVEGTNMKDTIEETAKILEQIAGQVISGIESLYDESVTYHDQLQSNLNAQAYNSCRVTGVTKIA